MIEGDSRYTIIDSEHILDNTTGVKYHLYDDWFKITHDGKVVIKVAELRPSEQAYVWQMKQLITDPDEAKIMKEQYPELLKSRRKAFSDLYENPIPVIITDPVLETETEIYEG